MHLDADRPDLARVYLVIAHPYLEALAKLVIGVRYPYLRYASAGVAIVGALHWWQLLNILRLSLQARELVFASPSPSSKDNVFGIESSVFRAVFTARELAEIVSQTFQARRSSELLPRPWLNHLLVALIMTNCWSTPIVQHFLGRHEGVERVVCLCIDALLNIGSSMAIPLVIFLPYYRALSPVTLTFPVEMQYNAVSYSMLVTETLLLFSLDTFDVLSKLVQHLGIYSSLTTVILTALALSRANFTGFPDGLLEPLPATLQHIQFTHTNLTTLPSDLHAKWHPVVTLYVEYSQIREFPRTLVMLPVRELSLHGNRIATLPELADFHQQLFSFVMSANPLVSLPDSLGAGAAFKFFSAERTELQSLPSWMRTSVSEGMFLYGTPYCVAQTTKERACEVRDNRVEGKAPIAVFDAVFPV
ncbi:hypothetical protein PybrP1_011916 [[Pythium] brassicae (nom. inval.)]|nr:hypothetical protein PybrP1_011916 [[Pythium] brassicae (nom. inval.)]